MAPGTESASRPSGSHPIQRLLTRRKLVPVIVVLGFTFAGRQLVIAAVVMAVVVVGGWWFLLRRRR